MDKLMPPESLNLQDIQLSELKRRLLFPDNCENNLKKTISQQQIEYIIPHRYPFLLVDDVQLINLKLRVIKTVRKIANDDPVFQGHFPDNPLYPGVLQQESMFQSALILMFFLLHNSPHPPDREQTIPAVGTRIYDVFHLSAVRPGDTMTIRCAITEYDSLLVTAIAQITVSDTIVTIGKGEFCVL